MSAHHRIAAIVSRACRTLESADKAPTLGNLAADAGLSPWYFQRVFKHHVGVTPAQYGRGVRTKNFHAQLRNGASVTDAIYAAGFGSSSRAYEGARRGFAMTPTSVKNGGAGETIHYAVARCALGWLLVAATARGICAIQFADRARALPGQLREIYPNARLQEADADLKAAVAKIVGAIEVPGTALDLPLDIRGTAFQQRVWRELQRIPVGRTVTYSELAERVGSPSAVRAVAAACASNKLAVAVPCHRVIGKNGSLTGYRWGVERKQSLLERERGGRKRS